MHISLSRRGGGPGGFTDCCGTTCSGCGTACAGCGGAWLAAAGGADRAAGCGVGVGWTTAGCRGDADGVTPAGEAGTATAGARFDGVVARFAFGGGDAGTPLVQRA